ncbi:hypothetical protein R1flu_015424 [Riccia fluitans]|uniref:Uncharacterized protein n=1 Tax=Riccia fluitans TaxID=41844 RepID=A0ABD1YIW5_9MARC
MALCGGERLHEPGFDMQPASLRLLLGQIADVWGRQKRTVVTSKIDALPGERLFQLGFLSSISWRERWAAETLEFSICGEWTKPREEILRAEVAVFGRLSMELSGQGTGLRIVHGLGRWN